MAKETILIVDDDPDLMLGLRVWLQDKGYKVICAPDPVIALAAVRREQPRLIILDIGLPAGDGMTFLQRLRAMADVPRIPVIVLSAKDSSFANRALDAGAQAFFQKPADYDQLLASIAGLI
jgi:two-component system response regulator MprA